MNDEPDRPPDRQGPAVLYLGIGGVLQPSWSTYAWVHGRDPFSDGHTPYECAPMLEELLEGWPEVRIALTSTRPWKHGLQAVLTELGPRLAARVIGHTFHDLTARARFGAKFPRPLSEMDYWRMSKSAIVEKHVQWLRPSRWVAVEDEDYGWSDQELDCNVVLTPPLEGLMNAAARAKLRGLLVYQLGPSTHSPETKTGSSDGEVEPTAHWRRMSEQLFDPDEAKRFSVVAAARAFEQATVRTRVLVLGLAGTLYTFVNGQAIARPHLYKFLDSSAAIFERIVVMPDDIEEFRETAEQLVREGAAPEWLAEMDCIAWNRRAKDLWRVGVLELDEVVAVDADRGFIVAEQEAQWLNVSTFDGSPQDFELIRVYELLQMAVRAT